MCFPLCWFTLMLTHADSCGLHMPMCFLECTHSFPSTHRPQCPSEAGSRLQVAWWPGLWQRRGDPIAPGPHPPHPVPRFTWQRQGDPSAGRAVPVTGNVSCRISCGVRGLAVGSGGTLKGEEVAPLLGSPVRATPPPHLELIPSAEPVLGGLGRRARCSVLFWDHLGEGKAPCWLLRF